jgi:8-oxo-dGTP diphosphatase
METNKPYCYEYPRPALTVDCMVISGKDKAPEILLIKRKHEPFKDCWAFPGGFVDMDETTDEAVCRELFEETGLKLDNFEQYKTFSAVDRDPRGRTISLVYYVFTNRDTVRAQAGDDASETGWFLLDQLPPLAFDHLKILESALSFLGIRN